MPLTKEQAMRQRAEGSLRRKFDHFVSHLPEESLKVLTEKWGSVESMLEAVLAAGAASDAVKRAPQHPLSCVTRPVRDKNGEGYHEEPCG